MPENQSPAADQVILIGASNVAIGFSTATGLLRAGLSAPLDLRMAIGHGRSYGRWSRFAGRSLPGIVDCGLWRAIESTPALRRHALLTDVGNDLMYGRLPEEIAGWVRECLQRLSNREAVCTITRLPVARVERLSPWRYHSTRLLFFPGHRPIGWPEMLQRARDLDDHVAKLANEFGASVITPPDEWYGVDPIHIRRGLRPRAWREIFGTWPAFDASCEVVEPGARLFGRFAEEYRLLGRPGTQRQPVISTPKFSVSLY